MKLRRQLLKVLKWNDESLETIVYRYPMDDRDEIMYGCQLIVGESQVAILAKEGEFADVFGPGRHTLETKNIPLLTKIMSLPWGFDSPFKCDVYFVNTKQFINQKWGTSNPVIMRDKEFGPVRIQAFGKYAFKVVEAPKFIRQVSGTNGSYVVASLKEHLKTVFVTGFSDALGEAGIPVLDLASKYTELAEVLKKDLASDFEAMGLEITAMYIENISLPEEVEKVLDKRTSMGVIGDKMGTYVTYEAAGAMRDAANNQGNGLTGAGIGIGAGMSLGQMMGQALNNAKDAPVENNSTPVDGVKCPSCGANVQKGAKFCSECGAKMPVSKFCSECGAKLSDTAKFCSECGHKVE